MKEHTVDDTIKGAVRQAYGTIARQFDEGSGPQRVQAGCCEQSESSKQATCCGGSEAPQQTSCCGPTKGTASETGAARFYSDQELNGLPETVTDASLGCGNPIAIASLKPGETVLDLGSGGGIDCFLAARQVGDEGMVIGLDMTPDMIKLARRNARKLGMTNVDFRFGEMEDIPLPDASVDVIISNCVINLSPDKDVVFGEAYRVLRPGGRMMVSDIVVDGELPQPVRDNLNAWAGCIAGALDEADYMGKIRAAGFSEVDVLSSEFAEIEDAEEWKVLDQTGVSAADLDRKVASVKVQAYKPA